MITGKRITYVDVRPMLYQMKQTGMMSAKDIQKSREEIEKKMNDIGEEYFIFYRCCLCDKM